MMRRRWVRYGAVALVFSVFAGIAVLTYGEGPAVLRSVIEKKLREDYRTRSRIETTDFHLFPFPHVSLEGVDLENDGALFSMESLDFYPDLWRLVMGKAVLSSVKISNPDLRILSWPKLREILNTNKKEKKSFCDSLSLPDFSLGVSGGRISCPVSTSPSGGKTKKTAIEFSDLSLKVASDKTGLRLKADLRSELTQALSGDVLIRKDQGSCRWDTEIEAESLDLAATGKTLAALFPENRAVRSLFPNLIRSGRLTSLVFSFSGHNDEWQDIRRMTAEAQAENAVIRLPGSRLDLREITGPIRLKNGMLDGEKLCASLGRSRAKDGRFSLDLIKADNGSRPFEIDTFIAADLSDLSSVLDAYLPALSRSHSLTRFESIQGTADLRLSLKHILRRPEVRVQADNIRAKAFYRALSRPVFLSNGSVRIEPDRLEWTGLQGGIGPHDIADCSGVFHFGKRKSFEISSFSGRADAGDLLRLSTRFPAVEKRIRRHLTYAAGPIRITSFSMGGTLSKPGSVRYHLTSSSDGLNLSAPGFPGPATVSFDNLDVSPEKIGCASMSVRINGQSFTLTGSVGLDGSQPAMGTVSIRGVVDGSFRTFLKNRAWIKPDFFPILPVELDPLTLSWSDRNLSVQGTFHRTDPRSGPITSSVDAAVSPTESLIRNLTFETRMERAEIKARIPADKTKGRMTGRFDGNLKGTTLAALFEKGDRIRGDIEGYASFEYPLSGQGLFRLKGPLALNNAVIRTEKGVSVTVDQARFNGQGEKAGMNLNGLSCALKPENGNGPDALFFPHIAGTVTFQKNGRCLLNVASGNVCGISFSGSVQLPDVDMDLSYASERQKVSSVQDLMGCFGADAPAMTGSLSVSGTIQGNPGMISKASFTIKASKGVVNKTTVLTKMLGLLDLTELFSGNPVKRIMERGYRYDTMDIEGTITGHNIHITQAAVTGAGINLYATGYADLSSRSLDLVVLASPFKLVDSLFYHIPLAGPLISGKNKSLLSVPLVVEGDFDSPRTRFLPKPLSAVSSGVLNTFVSVFKLPFVLTYDLVAPKGNR